MRSTYKIEKIEREIQMEMDSFKKSLKMGVLSGVGTYLLYVIYVITIGYLTKWHTFWIFDEAKGAFSFQPGGAISWEIAVFVGLILASLIPVFIMRYEKLKYAFSYIGVSLLICVWLYGTTLGAYYVIGDMVSSAVHCPFGLVDGFYYFVFVFLLGSAVGTAASFIFNFMRNKD